MPRPHSPDQPKSFCEHDFARWLAEFEIHNRWNLDETRELFEVHAATLEAGLSADNVKLTANCLYGNARLERAEKGR